MKGMTMRTLGRLLLGVLLLAGCSPEVSLESKAHAQWSRPCVHEYPSTAKLDAEVFDRNDRGCLAWDSSTNTMYVVLAPGSGAGVRAPIGRAQITTAAGVGTELQRIDFPKSGSPLDSPPSFFVNAMTTDWPTNNPDESAVSFGCNTAFNGSAADPQFGVVASVFECNFDQDASNHLAEWHLITRSAGAGSDRRSISIAANNNGDVAGISFQNDFFHVTNDALEILLHLEAAQATFGSPTNSVTPVIDRNNIAALSQRDTGGIARTLVQLNGSDIANYGTDGNLAGVAIGSNTVAKEIYVGAIGDGAIDSWVQFVGNTTDLTPLVGYRSQGSGGATVEFYVGTQDPNGVVTAKQGSVYYRVANANSNICVNRSAGATGTTWACSI